MSFLQSLKVSLENEELLDENGEVMEVTDADMAEADAEFAESEALRQQAERDLEQAERAEAVVEELEGTNEAIRAAVDNGTFTREAAAMVEAQRRTAAVALNLDPEEGAGEELVDNPGLESMVFNQGVIALEQNEGMIAKIRKTISAIVDKVMAFFRKIGSFFKKLLNILPSKIKKTIERWKNIKANDISDENLDKLAEDSTFVNNSRNVLWSVDKDSFKDILMFVADVGELTNALNLITEKGQIKNATSANRIANGGYPSAIKKDGMTAFAFASKGYAYKLENSDNNSMLSMIPLKFSAMASDVAGGVKESEIKTLIKNNNIYDKFDSFLKTANRYFDHIKKMDSVSTRIGQSMSSSGAKMNENAVKSLTEKAGKEKDSEKAKVYQFYASVYSARAGLLRLAVTMEQESLKAIRESISAIEKYISLAEKSGNSDSGDEGIKSSTLALPNK